MYLLQVLIWTSNNMKRKIAIVEKCFNFLKYVCSISFSTKHLQGSLTTLHNSQIKDSWITNFYRQIKLFNQYDHIQFKKNIKIINWKKNGSAMLSFILSILIFFNNILLASCVCPRLCECKWKYGKESVLCVNANISSIPNNIDSGTQILDLTGNLIFHIKNDIFANLELLNLQKLIFSKCRLKLIERYAFRELNNLVELDLSYNRLTMIPSHTFDFIPELREIRLNGNPINKINNDAFARVPKLTRIELSYCNISIIEQRAFEGIEHTLEWLKLNGNKLVQVMPETLTRLQNLHGLELAQNLWNCSCTLKPLRYWMIKEKIPYNVPPTCQIPLRLFNKSWDKIDLDDFACVPVIIPNQITVYGVEGKNITLSCSIRDDGETNVRWTLKDRLIANLTYTSFNTLEINNNNTASIDFVTSSNHGRKVFWISLLKSISNLSISIVEQRDAGIYTCVAENKAGWAEAHITLIVSRKFLYSSIGKNILVLCLFVASILLVLASLIGLWKFSIKNKRKHVVLWNNISSRCNSYEKIEMGQSIPHVNNEICDNENRQNIWKNLDQKKIPNNFDGNDSKTIELEINLEDCKYNNIKQNNSDDGNINKFNSNVVVDNIPFSESREVGDAIYAKDLHIPWSAYTTSSTPDFLRYNTNNAELNTVSNTFQRAGEYFSDLERICAGGINDSNAIFTLPRNSKNFTKYSLNSYNSQSHLLQDNYSQFDPTTSLERLRRFSDESSYLPTTEGTNSRRSNSSSSLLKRDSKISSSATVLSLSSYNDFNLNSVHFKEGASNKYLNSEQETPLLNFSSYVQRNKKVNHASATSLNDFHTAQIERFLEEYRSLQEQLCKMKETCEEICKKETTWKNFETSSGGFDKRVIFDSVISETGLQTSNDKFNESSLTFRTPDPPPYWMHQNLALHKLNNAGCKIYRS